MKRLSLLALAAVCTSLALRAQTADTLVVVRPQRVTVVTSDSLQLIRIDGKEADSTYRYQHVLRTNGNSSSSAYESSGLDFNILPFRRTPSGRGVTISVGLSPALGFVTAFGTPRDMEVNVGASKELALNNVLRVDGGFKGRRHRWSVALGFNWKNFRMKGATRFAEDAQEAVVLTPYGADERPKFSRIKVFSTTVTLLYSYKAARHCTLSFGPVVNFNSHGSLKTRYKADGKKVKETADDLHLTPITLDLLFKARIHSLGFYVKYSPSQLFREGYGPKFTSLSFGIYF